MSGQDATDQVYARLTKLQLAARPSVIGGEIASDADRIREALQVLRSGIPAIIAKALAERISLLCRPFGQAGRGVIGAGDQRDHQELQGVYSVGERCGHQGSPDGGIAAAEKPIADCTSAHRLSGEPK